MATNGKHSSNFPEMRWDTERWKGIERPYTYQDVERLRGTLHVEYTLAKAGAARLWELLHTTPYVSGLGAVTGNQAVQMVKAGLPSIYVSGWQVAADVNNSGQTYPDQSLYPADSVPALCKRLNAALTRADQIAHAEGKDGIYWYAPLIADAEAGFGGVLNAFELMKQMIEAGAAAVHFEDQLSSAKKCGHLGGKVLVPTQEGVQKLVAARLAADVLGVDTVLIARTDANSAQLITSDVDPRDRQFIIGSERTHEGFYRVKGGIDSAIARGVAYAPYVDLLWCETAEPNLEEARQFAEGVHKHFPGKMLAYNCSPSFNWKKKLDDKTIARFRDALAEMGFKYQFITLAGFHAMNLALFELSRGYNAEGMTAYSRLQEREFELESQGYEAIKHQKFVGTGYFDEVTQTITGGLSSVTALKGSTEEEQFLERELEAAVGEGMHDAPHRTPTSPAELASIDPMIAGERHQANTDAAD
jgi:isocitrate lyase